ncbi:MAG: hypothetical protein LBQ59_00855 [Candidatus Peribacteria bacterium]|nr:hypothetical protein [Candidatus Peribacteria bacterium]
MCLVCSLFVPCGVSPARRAGRFWDFLCFFPLNPPLLRGEIATTPPYFFPPRGEK